MRAGLDDLVTALYVTIDDLLGPDPRRGRPGRKPRLSDSELVCLAVAQVLLGCHGEHRWIRFCYCRLGHLFPYLPGQPGYNKRLRQARWLLDQVMAQLAGQTPSVQDTLRLLDATPVPCAASRQTVKRSALRGWADYGWCPSHSRWYWGLKLYAVTTPDGSPVAWCLASPKLGEREVATALLDRDTIKPGQVLIVDKGLASAEVDRQVGDLGAVLVRPDRRDEPTRFGSLRPVRQWIESVIDTLKGQLGLEQHGGRTPAGVQARVAQRLLALAAAIWFNWQLGAEHKRSLVAYDHCDDPGGGRGVGLTRDSGGSVPGFRPVDPRHGRHAGRRAVAVTGLTQGSTGLLPARRSVGPRLWPRDASAVATWA